MVNSVAVISTIAAVVSAIGGAFAAVAAFRSAESARAANETAQISEKRVALRELTIIANKISVEGLRANKRGGELKMAYQTLFTFAESSGGSRQVMYLAEVNEKLKEIEELSDLANPFLSGPESLMNGPVQEILSREIRMAQTLTKMRGIREDLELEYAGIEAQNKTYRDKVVQGSGH